MIRARSPFCFLFILSLAASSAKAVVIYEKDRSVPPIRAVLVRQDATVVVFDQVLPGGMLKRRQLSKDKIDFIQTVVKTDRLSELRAGDPKKYRDYAEELKEKRKDPEAEAVSLRLYLIAAYLDPRNLGRSCLLGMTDLARSPGEARKFRAMAYLLDPVHDQRRLKRAKPPAPKSVTRTSKLGRTALLNALKALRDGRRAEARRTASRATVQAQFAALDGVLSHDEFMAACNLACSDCKEGRQTCRLCQGQGKRVISGRQIRCSACQGAGRTNCSTCQGRHLSRPLPPEMVFNIISAELFLYEGGQRAAAKPQAGWSQIIESQNFEPLPSLRLETLTEFDPRKCHFRDGKWVEP